MHHDKQAIADHFQQLVQKLPIPHQHLLLYLVDLLSLFASNADVNSMDSSKLADIFTSRIIGSCVNQYQAQSLVQFLIGSQALFMKQLYHGSPKETNMHEKHHQPVLSSSSATLPLMAPRPIRPIPINLITKESITFVPPTLHHAKQARRGGHVMQKSSDSSSNHRHTSHCQATASSLSTFQRTMDTKIKVLIKSWQGLYIHTRDKGVRGNTCDVLTGRRF